MAAEEAVPGVWGKMVTCGTRDPGSKMSTMTLIQRKEGHWWETVVSGQLVVLRTPEKYRIVLTTACPLAGRGGPQQLAQPLLWGFSWWREGGQSP